jgi:hypothetical protein
MISPTDLFHPSPAPHFKTFQVFLIYCPKRELVFNVGIEIELSVAFDVGITVSTSIPLNQSKCIFPRNSRVQMILCAMLHNSIAHNIICTVRLFRGKMHSDWFNEIVIL